MSPLQYIKILGLHEARKLMLAEDFDATSASYEVGNDSSSQCSREYKRLFGDSPQRDIKKVSGEYRFHILTDVLFLNYRPMKKQ